MALFPAGKSRLAQWSVRGRSDNQAVSLARTITLSPSRPQTLGREEYSMDENANVDLTCVVEGYKLAVNCYTVHASVSVKDWPRQRNPYPN